MSNPEQQGLAEEFSHRLHHLKNMPEPDRCKIVELRAQLDQAVEDGKISLREWRALIEQCSHVRRTRRG